MSSKSRLLQDKLAVVTGGTRGIGLAVARMLAREGACVLATSRNAAKSPLKISPGTVCETVLDVRSEQSVVSFFEALEKQHGGVDLLVNNAGIGVFKPVSELTLEEWNDVLATNLTGAFLCAREAFKLMKKGSGGRIINIGSVADHQAIEGNGAYSASKFGLRGLSLVLTEEGKKFGVQCSLVSPGAVFTDIWKGRPGFRSEDMLDPDDVAMSVLDIACRPSRVRIDEVKIMPPRGIL